MVPDSLKSWFFIHFVVDYLVAVPLMIAPVEIMTFLGWPIVEPVATRLVAAALIGVGGVSLLARGSGIVSYVNLLDLKLLWSGAAIIGLLLSLTQGAPAFTWVFLATFIFFFLLWGFYRRILKGITG